MSTEGMLASSFDPDDPDSSDAELDDEPYNGGQAFAVADDPGEWLSVAVDHMENGKVDRAQECFENATKCSPDGANGLSKAFDTSFERYLHALLRTAVYGGQELQDDLVDTCRNLCVNSGRWALAALCLHILGEDETNVLEYVELVLVEEGSLDIQSDLPFADRFEDKYEEISDLVGLAWHYELELGDSSESDRILGMHHRTQIRGKESAGTGKSLVLGFTAAKIADITASAIEAKKREMALQLQQKMEKAAKWKFQIEQIVSAALEGRHSCNFRQLVDAEKLRSLGFDLEGGWMDLERQTFLKTNLEQLVQSCSDSYFLAMNQVENFHCNLTVPKFADFCNDASNLMRSLQPGEEFQAKFAQRFSGRHSIQSTSKAMFSRDLISLADQIERLLLLSERVDVVNQTNNSTNLGPKGEVTVNWKHARGYTILSKPQSAQMMHWLSTDALPAMEHILCSVADAADDGRSSVNFGFSCDGGQWRAKALNPSDDSDLFSCQYSVASVDPFLLSNPLHTLGYGTKVFAVDVDGFEVFFDASDLEVTEQTDLAHADRGRLLSVSWAANDVNH